MEPPILKEIPSEKHLEKYFAGSDGFIYHRMFHSTDPAGHQRVSLHHPNTNDKHSRPVHQLICEAFHGPKPSPEMEVRHLDGNPKNNNPDNLKWGTRLENIHDKFTHGTTNAGKKIRQLTHEDRIEILRILNSGELKIKEIAFRYGVCLATITNIRYRWSPETGYREWGGPGSGKFVRQKEIQQNAAIHHQEAA